MRSVLLNILKKTEKYTKTDMIYVVKNSFWINTNTIIITILSFITSVLIANLLTKETYGIYQFILSIGLIINSLTLTGMNIAVTQAVARGFDGVLKSSIKLQLKLAFIPFLTGLLISIYYFLNNNKILSLGILLTSIIIPLTNALNTWSAYLNGKKDFKTLFSYNQIINFLYYGSLFFCIFIAKDAIYLVSITLIANLISNYIAYRFTNKKYKITGNEDGNALDYGIKLSISGILPTIAIHIDNLIIFHFLGAQNLAIYLFASNIPERFMNFLRPISNIALPKMATQKPEEIAKTMKDKIFRFLLLSSFFGIVYVIISPFVFNTIFKQYTDSIIYSQIYIISLVISTISSLPMTSLYATKSKKVYILNIIHPIFSITVLYLFIYKFGIWGAIYGKILTNIFLLTSSVFFIFKKNAQ